MEIKCDKCNSKLSISDEKLPKGKVAAIRCPKCKGKVTVDLNSRASNVSEPETLQRVIGFEYDMESDEYDASEKPFDFLEEEGKTALICENNEAAVDRIQEVLIIMEYHITVAKDVRDALRKMKYHVYDLILVNDTFCDSEPSTNGVLVYLERLGMDVRRNIFVTMITRRYATMDRMAAFLNSVNITLNINDMQELDKVIGPGLRDYDLSYAVYKENQKRLSL